MNDRVYLPTTVAGLADYDERGVVPASIERVRAEDDSEEAEYAALMSAADASAALLEEPGRRVVLVAELEPAASAEAGEIPMRLVVAVHIDTEDDADPDDDLAWYATQEIPELLAGR